MGIRDPIEWNHASILYQLWKIIQPNANSLWINWVRQSLFKNKSIWTASACPWSIRKILNYRSEVIPHIQFQIGSHSRFFLWHVLWLDQKPIIAKYGQEIISIMEASNLDMISTFIQDGHWVEHH